MPINQQYLAQLFGNPIAGDGISRGAEPNPQYVSASGQETFNPGLLNANGMPDFTSIPTNFSEPVQDAALATPPLGGVDYAKAGMAGVGALSGMLNQQPQQQAPMAPAVMPQGNPIQLSNHFQPMGMLNRRRM